MWNYKRNIDKAEQGLNEEEDTNELGIVGLPMWKEHTFYSLYRAGAEQQLPLLHHDPNMHCSVPDERLKVLGDMY